MNGNPKFRGSSPAPPAVGQTPSADRQGWRTAIPSDKRTCRDRSAVNECIGDLALSQKLSSRHRRPQGPIPCYCQEHGGQVAAAIVDFLKICDASNFDQKSHSLLSSLGLPDIGATQSPVVPSR
jgi:hypothetical protein